MHPVIKWSGSKRSQANIIKSYVPSFNTYYEPFIGGGSILYALHPQKAICGDIYEPLINLWNEIKNNPQQVADEYKKRWLKLQDLGEDFYYQIRKQFNQSHSIYDFLFLSRTCTNGLIRFNKKGEFNTSFHFSRKGINPSTLENIINDWSKQLQNTTFIHGDYEYTTSNIKENDFVYLDPPYANTKGMYFGSIDYYKFFTFLEILNKKMLGLSFPSTENVVTQIKLLMFQKICINYTNILNQVFHRSIVHNKKLSMFKNLYT